MRERLLGNNSRQWLLPPASRLDERPDLTDYEIGRYSWGHLTVPYRTAGARLSIGQFCSFAYGCMIILGGEHRTDFVSTYRFPAYPPFNEMYGHLKHETVRARGDVTIGNDVWIGQQALILSGVTLGDGVVVGAGSVVRQSAPPYAIVVGNPARVAGYRFAADQIEALERIKWWDWPEHKIVEAMNPLMSDDIENFINTFDPGPSA